MQHIDFVQSIVG